MSPKKRKRREDVTQKGKRDRGCHTGRRWTEDVTQKGKGMEDVTQKGRRDRGCHPEKGEGQRMSPRHLITASQLAGTQSWSRSDPATSIVLL